MATQKIKMRNKTATGYDLVHPETVATQVYVDEKQLPDWLLENYINKERNLEGLTPSDVLDGIIAYKVKGTTTEAVVIERSDLLAVLKVHGSYFGHFENLNEANLQIPDDWKGLGWSDGNVFCFLNIGDNFGIGVFRDNGGIGEFINIFPTISGGVNIVVAETDPGNLNVGDWWYEVIPEVAP